MIALLSRRPAFVFVAAVLSCSLGVAVGVRAQGAAPPQGRGQQGPPAPTGPMAPEKYKDIQVMTDVPADQVDVTMRYFVAATGIQCQGCHFRDSATGQVVYERESRGKTTARQMINLVKTVNAGDFGGNINCGTCHAGRNQPAGLQLAQMMTDDQIAAAAAQAAAREAAAAAAASRGAGPGGDRGGPPPAGGDRGAAPPQGAAGGAPPQGAPGGRGNQPPPPPIDELVGKLTDGMGGQAALAKLSSRLMTGTVTHRDKTSAAFTLEEKGKKFHLTMANTPAAVAVGFDGTSGWTKVGTQIADLDAFPTMQASWMADLALPLRLKDTTRYSNLQSGRPTRLPGAAPGQQGPQVNLITATMTPYTSERLYFDATTGLLLRRQIITRAAYRGSITEQFDYGDYRDVAGVKMPYEIKHTTPTTFDTFKVTDIKPNANINDAQFGKPKS